MQQHRRRQQGVPTLGLAVRQGRQCQGTPQKEATPPPSTWRHTFHLIKQCTAVTFHPADMTAGLARHAEPMALAPRCSASLAADCRLLMSAPTFGLNRNPGTEFRTFN